MHADRISPNRIRFFFFKFSKLFRSIFSLFLSLFFFFRGVEIERRKKHNCRVSPLFLVFYHVPSAKLNHLKIHHALSLRERERERRERERRARRFERRATTRASYPHTFVRELMILIHQPTFRFEEDEGYATRVLLINRSTPPRGGIASSNRPNSDEFLATDFAPLTQFFRPRKIEKTVAVGAAVAVFTTGSTDVLHRILSSSLPIFPSISFLSSFLPFSLRKVGGKKVSREEI